MKAILLIFGTVIFEFLLELYVFHVIFTRKLRRKNKLLLRLMLSTLALLGVSFGAAAFYNLFGDTLWGRVIVYLFLFMLSVVQGVLLFDESVWTVVFCGSMAYAAQNLVYKLYLVQYYFGKLAGIYDFHNDAFGIIMFRLMYYIVFAGLTACVFFVMARKIYARLSYHRLNYKIFISTLVILGITVLLCSAEDIFFEKIGMGVAEAISMSPLFVLRQTGNILSAICCGTVIFLLFRTLEKRDLQYEVSHLQRAVRQSEQQYNISKDTINMINIKCHDIKYKLDAAIDGGSAQPEILDDLRRSIAIYDANIQTGNKYLDVLFTEKSLYCESNGIVLSCMIDGAKLGFMRPGDLYCLFGNIADNALDAVTKIDQKDKRVINIVVKSRDNMVIVQADNFFAGSMGFADGLPMTTKDDKSSHGFGMQSMRMIVRKYGGEMIINTSGDVFRLSILFPDTAGAESGV